MKNKIQYFENLRVIAILCVILYHALYPIMDIAKNPIGASWWAGNIIISCLRFMIPVFIMQSGALLLSSDKNSQIIPFLKSRFIKIFIPFITWTVLFSYYASLTTHHSFITNIKYSLQMPIYPHLWYLYALMGLYLVTPIFQTYVKHATKTNLLYFLALWFLITGVLPFILKITGVMIDVRISYVAGFIGYFILGYVIHKFPIPKKIQFIAPIVAIFSVICIIPLTYIVTLHGHHPKGQTDFYFHDNLSLFVITLSAAVFVMAKYSKWLSSFDLSFNGKLNIARICFGVYLFQSLVIDVLQRYYHIGGTPSNPIWGCLQSFAVTTLISFGLFIVLDLMQKYRVINNLSRFIY